MLLEKTCKQYSDAEPDSEEDEGGVLASLKSTGNCYLCVDFSYLDITARANFFAIMRWNIK